MAFGYIHLYSISVLKIDVSLFRIIFSILHEFEIVTLTNTCMCCVYEIRCVMCVIRAILMKGTRYSVYICICARVKHKSDVSHSNMRWTEKYSTYSVI